MNINFKNKAERPRGEELKKIVLEKGYSQAGKDLGVSDNAVRKWLKVDGIVMEKIKKGKVEVVCELTGEKFMRNASDVERNAHHYKDDATSRLARTLEGKLATLTREKYEDLREEHSMRTIAEMYGCKHSSLQKKFN